MIKPFFPNPAVFKQLHAGPFFAYIDVFAQEVSDRGYAVWTAKYAMRLLAALGTWLEQEGLTISNQILGAAVVAAQTQEAMFETAAFEVILELPQNIRRQLHTLLRQMGSEYRVVFFDDLIEKGLLGPVALVTGSIPVPGGYPGRHLGHNPRTVEPLRVSFSTSSLTLRSSLRNCVFIQSIDQLQDLEASAQMPASAGHSHSIVDEPFSLLDLNGLFIGVGGNTMKNTKFKKSCQLPGIIAD